MSITHQAMINASRNTIATAQRVLADREFAKIEVRRIYKGRDLRGMLQRHQKYARQTLLSAKEAGLTVEKPYKIVKNAFEFRGQKAHEVIGMMGSSVVPMWHVNA